MKKFIGYASVFIVSFSGSAIAFDNEQLIALNNSDIAGNCWKTTFSSGIVQHKFNSNGTYKRTQFNNNPASEIISTENWRISSSCPEDWPQRLINNTWFEASGFIETQQGKYNCQVLESGITGVSFAIKCNNGSVIYLTEDFCDEDDPSRGDPNRRCADFIFLIDKNGSEFKMNYEIIMNQICNNGIMTQQLNFIAFQSSFRFSGSVIIKLRYRPVLKPGGF